MKISIVLTGIAQSGAQMSPVDARRKLTEKGRLVTSHMKSNSCKNRYPTLPVIYCCIESEPRMYWLKTATILLFFPIMWVRNSGRVWLVVLLFHVSSVKVI